MQVYIQQIEEKRDELAARARPPEAVIQAALADPEIVALGAGLNQRFAAILNSRDKGQHQSVLERARLGVVDYLSHFPPQQRQRILLGALGSVYGKEGEAGADTAVWLDVVREETVGGNGRFPWLIGLSPARETMAALRQVGVLDEVIETTERLVVYPAGLEAEG